MDPKKVFISYSHDSPEHAARVAGLAASLRRDGVDCWIDQYVDGTPPQGWPLWMEKTIEWAEFVLVVCTETYLRRVRKEEPPAKGLGATWEARLIYQHLYEAHIFNAKFVPVVFEAADKEFIPAPLRGGSHYVLDGQKGYDRLYVTVTGQHTAPPDIGPVKSVLEPQTPPSFGEPGGAASAAALGMLKKPKLKAAIDPPYPDEPYPLLRPYTHPELFAGRERELDELEKLLADNIPVLGLYSTSGAGKSSLLAAGLSPRLRRKGSPVAYTAYPKDRELARRLLEAMLEWEDGGTVGDDDPGAFREAVRTVYDLCGNPGVLVLDQFEDLMDPADNQARERVGRLLTGTIEERPFCHWVLSYRHEYHGRVEEWLQDAFRRDGVTWRGRFRTFSLKPLGHAESMDKSRKTFLEVLNAPLKVKDENGEARYRLFFCEGGAERLAAAFARARAEQPQAPLLPELQVVLAHLIKE